MKILIVKIDILFKLTCSTFIFLLLNQTFIKQNNENKNIGWFIFSKNLLYLLFGHSMCNLIF